MVQADLLVWKPVVQQIAVRHQFSTEKSYVIGHPHPFRLSAMHSVRKNYYFQTAIIGVSDKIHTGAIGWYEIATTSKNYRLVTPDFWVVSS